MEKVVKYLGLIRVLERFSWAPRIGAFQAVISVVLLNRLAKYQHLLLKNLMYT